MTDGSKAGTALLASRLMIRAWRMVALLVAVAFVAPASTFGAAPVVPELGLIRVDGAQGIGLGLLGADGSSVGSLIPPGSKDLPNPLFVSPPSWTPDGETLVFSGGPPGGDESGGLSAVRLYAIPGDGGRPIAIPGTAGGLDPLVLPDGKTMTFLRARGVDSVSFDGHHVTRTRASYSLWLSGIDGSEARRLTPWRAGGTPVPVSASPDGETLVAIRTVDDKARPRNEAVLIGLDGRVKERLGKGVEGAAFSPDGSRLALVKEVEFAHPHVTRAKGGRTITAYGQTDLFVRDLPTGFERRLTQGPASDSLPSWDPSGERLAFTRLGAIRGEAQELFGLGDAVLEVNADGTCLAPVRHEPQTGFLNPVWRPGPGREAGALTC